MSSISKNSNSKDLDSSSEENSYLKKDDEDLELEEKEKEKEKNNKIPKKTEKNKYTNLFSKANVFPIRYPFLRKRARKLSFGESSSDDELDKKIKTDLANNYLETLTEFEISKAKSEKEIFESNFNILKSDYKIIEQYEELIFKDTSIDIMFIMDLTGSMGCYLSETKRNIKKIVEEISEQNPGSKIRIGFVGYRDFDTPDEKRNYERIEFTENIDNFIDSLKNFHCFGGGDQPEDVAGGLNEALKMDWKSTARYVVLVCDAPCHGNKYHDIYIDTFKDGDPAGLEIEDLMRKFKNMNTTFYCMEINSYTQKMFDIMKSVYNDDNKFCVEKIYDSCENLSFIVAFSASELLGNTKYNQCDFIKVLEKCRKESIDKIMKKYNQNNIINESNDNFPQSLINEIENMNLDGEDKELVQFINRINNLNIDNNLKDIQDYKIENDKNSFIEIQLTEKEIIENINKDFNFTIYGLTYNKNTKNAFNSFTDPLIIEQKFNSNISINNINDEMNMDTNENTITFSDNKLLRDFKGTIPKKIEKKYLADIKLLSKNYCLNDLICEQIADYFNMELKSETSGFIKFKKNVIYLQEEQDNNQLKLIITDNALPFSLNLASHPDKKILQAFSHFSYQITLGELIILNLEYNKENQKITSYDIFSLKDNGYKHILKFFSNHFCNNYCKYLNLVHPRKKATQVELNELFFSKKYNTNYILCKCCSMPLRKYSNDIYCCRCACEKIKSLKRLVCEECHQLFDCFTYVYNSNLINYPTKCSNCQKQNFII